MKQNCKPLSKRRWPAPTKNYPKQQIISRTEQRYVGRTAVKGNTTDTRLDQFIVSWIQGRTQEFYKGGGWNFEKNILLSLKYRLPYLL